MPGPSLLIPTSIVQPLIWNTDLTAAILERASGATAKTSILSLSIWTKPSRTVAPTSFPRGPLHFPSRISDEEQVNMEIATRLPRHPPSSSSLILLTLVGWPIWPINIVPELFTTAAEYLHHRCLIGVLPLCKSTRLKTVVARAIVSVDSGHLRR